MLTARTRAGLMGLALLIGVSTSAWAQAPTVTATVTPTDAVVLTWTPTAGATGYVLEATVAGLGVFNFAMGNVTSFTTGPLPHAAFSVRILPQPGPASSPVTFTVPRPPPTPANFGAIVNGVQTLFTWDLGGTAGVSNVFLQAGTAPGASNIGTFPLGVTESLAMNVPAGTYHTRVVTQGPGGFSAPSNEFVLTTPNCSGASLPLTMGSYFGFVTITWPAVPGATGYLFHVSSTPGGGPDLMTLTVPANLTRVTAPGIGLGNYYITVTAQLGCGATATSQQEKLTVDDSPGPGPRTPDPAPGRALPLLNRVSVVESVARQFPGDFVNSCREHGGNNRFLFRLVQRLRQEDSRWGLNWKRGGVGDMSQDVITYHYGPGRDEGSTQVYIIDVIAGHCGSPSPWWNDVTGVTREQGTVGKFTLVPYIQAGNIP